MIINVLENRTVKRNWTLPLKKLNDQGFCQQQICFYKIVRPFTLLPVFTHSMPMVFPPLPMNFGGSGSKSGKVHICLKFTLD